MTKKPPKPKAVLRRPINGRSTPKLRAADPKVQATVSSLFTRLRDLAAEAEVLAAKLEASRDRDQLQAGAESMRAGCRCLGHFTPLHVMRAKS